jgi:hypothetical protein
MGNQMYIIDVLKNLILITNLNWFNIIKSCSSDNLPSILCVSFQTVSYFFSSSNLIKLADGGIGGGGFDDDCMEEELVPPPWVGVFELRVEIWIM